MEFFAHRTESGRTQLLSEHLRNVAALAAAFVSDRDDRDLKTLAAFIGLLHDVGKYQPDFQQRLFGAAYHVDHAICGAAEALKLSERVDPKLRTAYLLAAYCIAGHHAGLPDFGFATDADGIGTLVSRLKNAGDVSPYIADLHLPALGTHFTEFVDADLTARYLFSCLTDADFLDTEAFCAATPIERGISCDFAALRAKFEAYRRKFACDTPIRRARQRLQAQIDATEADRRIYYLDMPTGSGKTMASLSLALRLAADQGRKRIIYVIPYTSIIEQTAAELKAIFGDAYVLEHHSNYILDPDGESDGETVRLARATENWDAPIIVTTNVRFFESVYRNKSSHLRKMHNMADSVLIFDEIQLLPVRYLQPCYAAISYLTERLGARAILMSATMPNLRRMTDVLSRPLDAHPLITNRNDYPLFRTCEIRNIGRTSDEVFLEYAEAQASLLLVAPTRKEARRLYLLLSEAAKGNAFHLSTYMNAVHRRAVIESIRRSLRAGEKTSVVSTSLIEAGVDLDFACVMRALSGLDSILQAAGRCNREGRRADCRTYVYTNEATDGIRDADLLQRMKCAQDTLNRYEDAQSKEAIEFYFDELYTLQKDTVASMNRKNFAHPSRYRGNPVPDFRFKTYADEFHLIDADTRGIVIPYDPDGSGRGAEILAEYRSRPDRFTARRLQPYTVNIYDNELQKLREIGAVGETNGICYLLRSELYRDTTGLSPDEHDDFLFV